MKAPRQQTVIRPAEMEGEGIHTGVRVRLRVEPAPANSGVVFQRTDVDPVVEIDAKPERVASTERGTTLGRGGVTLRTVEHFLAAVAALGIDNLRVQVHGPELPAGDGSSRDFLALFEQAGVEEQAAVARVLRVEEPFWVREESSSYMVAAADGYRVSTTIEFTHPMVGRQFGSYLIERETFAAELGSARTFGFVREVEELRARGLAMGGSTANAVVLTDRGMADGVELRYPDEFVRHKTLDIVGDLALVGGRIAAHVVAERPSHAGNVALVRELLARAEHTGETGPVLDARQILRNLPHRYPFLLVDRVVEYEARKRIVGIKNVTINEPFFTGHFPGHPIMPGVLIIEAMAQVGGLLLMDTVDDMEDKVVYFMSLDKVKWRRPVTPGDQIRFELEVLQIRGATCKMKGVGTVDRQVVAEAEMMARVVDR
ncbi:MAG: UDP-3-O-acyl-N-acetylglucosamine deacetylase [Longimicrobiaceae bacterium]